MDSDAASEKDIAEGKKKAGNTAFAKKDYPEAVRLYTEAIALDPSNHVYYSNRSACYAVMEQHEKAATDARECLRLNPDFVKGYYRLSTAQLELNDYQGALETVERGLKRDADNADLQRQLRIVRAKTAASSSTARKAQGSIQVDRQTMEEYQELNEQLLQTNRELAEVQAQLQTCQREKRRSALTRQEIEAVGDSTRLYRAVGKMFLANSKPEVLSNLDEQTQAHERAEEKLVGKKQYLETRLKAHQSSIAELVKHAQAG